MGCIYNQENALEGAFSVIAIEALLNCDPQAQAFFYSLFIVF